MAAVGWLTDIPLLEMVVQGCISDPLPQQFVTLIIVLYGTEASKWFRPAQRNAFSCLKRAKMQDFHRKFSKTFRMYFTGNPAAGGSHPVVTAHPLLLQPILSDPHPPRYCRRFATTDDGLCVVCVILQYETDCPLLVGTPECGLLMPGEQISVSLLLDG